MVLLLIILLFFLFIAALWIYPIELDKIASVQQPVFDYDLSVRHIEQKQADDRIESEEYGVSILLTHGRRVEHSIVFYHGFTNCPRQYEILAKRFFDAGYNVYVPRVPHHGIKDLNTKEIAKLTMSELMEVCDRSIDLAHGLGEDVTVFGLSMGGVMAAWNAQFRNDLNQSVVVVPSFGWYYLPGIIRPLINFSRLLPNKLFWWDPAKKDQRECPYSMYHHFSTKGMGHILRIGLSTLVAASKQKPKTDSVLVITNEMDYAVDGLATKQLAARWKSKGAALKTYEFSKSLNMEHDIIDPLHPYARVDLVYKKIMELMG